MCGQQELFQTCLFILLQYQCNAALTYTHFFPPASACVCVFYLKAESVPPL